MHRPSTRALTPPAEERGRSGSASSPRSRTFWVRRGSRAGGWPVDRGCRCTPRRNACSPALSGSVRPPNHKTGRDADDHSLKSVQHDLTYVTHDGVALISHLYRPAGAGRHPPWSPCTVAAGRTAPPTTTASIGAPGWRRGVCGVRTHLSLVANGARSFPEAVQDRAQRAISCVATPSLASIRSASRCMAIRQAATLRPLVALAGEHPLFRDGNAGDPFGRASHASGGGSRSAVSSTLTAQWGTRSAHAHGRSDREVRRRQPARGSPDRFDASPLSYVSSPRDNGTGLLVVEHR